MMLHAIREKAKGWFAWVIVLLISIPFALWGIGSYIAPDPNPPVAEVGDIVIGSYEFQNQVQNLLAQSRTQDSSVLKMQLLEQLINSKALIHFLREQGYRVSRATLSEYIMGDQNFRDPKTGKFSQSLFQRFLTRAGLSFESFQQKLEDDLVINQYMNGVQSSVPAVGDHDKMLALLNQQRDISYIEIDPQKFVADIKIDDSAIEKYYQDNPVQFEVPEQIKFAYIELSRKALARQQEIDTDQAQQYYQEHKAQYTQAEKRKASHILLTFDKKDKKAAQAAQEQAQEIIKQLKAGKDFAELAKQYSKDPGSASRGGDLGFFGKGEMVPAFEKAVFALKTGQISKPVKTDFGLHIIKLTAIQPAKVQPFEAVKNKIIQNLQFEQAEKPFYELSEMLQSITYEQPDSLEPAAEETGLKIQNSEYISTRSASGVFASSKVKQAVFTDEVVQGGNNSEVVDLGNDHLLVARVLDKKTAHIKPLQEVREEIVKTLKNKKAMDKAMQLAKQIEQASASDREKLLAEKQLSPKSIEKLKRNDFMHPQIAKTAFAMPRPGKQPVTKIIKNRGKVDVIFLNKVIDGKTDDKKMADMLIKQFVQAKNALLSNLIVRDVRQNTRVKIYQSRINREE